MNTIILPLIAYILGSIPFAVLVSRSMGLTDPRNYGSGNPGATNVLRSGNKIAALLTLIGDTAKGTLAVWLAQHYGASSLEIALIGFAVFFGHLYSLFLGFRGGKGVATAAGVLLGFSLWLGIGVLIVWGLVAWVFRYSSVAAIIAAALAPILSLVMLNNTETQIAVLAMSVFLVGRHAENLRRLAAGKESRIGEKKSPPSNQSAGNSA